MHALWTVKNRVDGGMDSIGQFQTEDPVPGEAVEGSPDQSNVYSSSWRHRSTEGGWEGREGTAPDLTKYFHNQRKLQMKTSVARSKTDFILELAIIMVALSWNIQDMDHFFIVITIFSTVHLLAILTHSKLFPSVNGPLQSSSLHKSHYYLNKSYKQS